MAEVSQAGSNAKLLSRFVELLDQGNLDRLGEVFAADVVVEWPQSGERIHGVENMSRVLGSYPGRGEGGFKTEAVEILGDEPRYVMTPTFHLVRIQGTGDNTVSVVKSQYPDGSRWWIIGFSVIRDNKIAKQVAYFAPAYDAPDWRAQWVEHVDPSPAG